jgi:hypothetical protein
MRAMRTPILLFTALSFSSALSFAGCALDAQSQGAKTPDEIIAEQEALGAEQLKKEDDHETVVDDEDTDLEKAKQFDKKQAKLELQRAGRSAETCPESLPEEEQAKAPRGTAEVELWFDNNGSVKKATLAPPHAETPVGACILRAMEAVIVPAFSGEIVQITWKIDLSKKVEAE